MSKAGIDTLIEQGLRWLAIRVGLALLFAGPLIALVIFRAF